MTLMLGSLLELLLTLLLLELLLLPQRSLRRS